MFEIFQYDFMIRAFIAGIIVAIIAPIIGIFLVVKRYSLIADTLSHVSLVGVAGSILLQVNPIIGALVSSVIAAVGMERLRQNKKLMGESVLALFLSGSLALAIILIGLARGMNVNFFSYLFGSITTVTTTDIAVIVSFGIGIVILLLLCYKQLFLIASDEELAKANGVPVSLYNTLLIILAAIAVSLSMRIVGVLLVGALMIIPVLTAIQYGLSFKKTIGFSLLFSVIAVISGLYFSYYFDLASGGTIVLSSIILFLLSLLLNRAKN